MARKVDMNVVLAHLKRAHLEPLEPYPGRHKPWRCIHVDCGREVAPRYGSLAAGRGGCGYCAGTKVDIEEALQMMRSVGLEPLVDFPGSAQPWPSRCTTCGAEMTSRYSDIKNGKTSGCTKCSGWEPDPDEIVKRMQAAGLEPLEPYPGSKAPWRCVHSQCGREVSPAWNSIRSGQGGCIFCSGKAVDEADIAEVLEAKGMEPLETYPGANLPWKMLHRACGRIVEPQWGNLRKAPGSGCRFCSPTYVDPLEAESALAHVGLKPLEPFPGTFRDWRVRHEDCNREVTVRYANVRKGGGCPLCRGKTADPEKIEGLLRDRGLEPLEAYPGRHKPWRLRHSACGREVTPSFASVTTGSGCRFCAAEKLGRTLILSNEQASEELRTYEFEPLGPYPGANKPWPATHNACGNVVSPRLGVLRRGDGKGCRYCSSYGITQTDSAFVYLLVHERLGALKIGIGKSEGKRLRVLGRTGWKAISVWTDLPGPVAYRVEYRVLQWWNEDSELGFVPSDDMPYGGHSETVDASTIDVELTKALVDSLIPEELQSRVDEEAALALQAKKPRKQMTPELACSLMENAGLIPLEPYPGLQQSWSCLHLACGNRVASTLRRIREGKPPCSFCSGRRVTPEQAATVMRDAGLEPLVAYPGSNKVPWPCRCVTCGRQVEPRYNSVSSSGTGCIYCAGQVVDDEQAKQVMLAAGLRPLEPYPGHNKHPWLCECLSCGRQVRPRYNSITSGQSGCAVCGRAGSRNGSQSRRPRKRTN